ncbi:MAG: hypothetical protein JKY56_14395 [Kofleriaceae bacterium]|nr:hypothetical protein [Kofleriaceae bacterium]
MAIYFIIAVVVVLVAFVTYWALTRGETVDLRCPNARARAAAQWLAQGESEEAEHMLRSAVEVLEGWDQVLARRDLANLLAATGQVEDAIEELELGLEQNWPEHEIESVEIQITSADLQLSIGRSEQAIVALTRAEQAHDNSTAIALLQESRGLLLIHQEEHESATSLLRLAFEQLSELGHDRTASTWVSLAYSLQCQNLALPWPEFDSLAQELQRAILTNMSDRLPGFASVPGQALLNATIQKLGQGGDWQAESQLLSELRNSLEFY